MQTFNLNYHKNSTLLFSMLLVPITIAGVTLLILLNLSPQLSEYFFISIIAISLLSMALALRWLINNKIVIPTEVSLNHEGLYFKLKKESFFYHTNDFFAGWEHVSNISEVFCSKTGKYFYRVSFKNPNFNVNFSAINDKQEEAEKFFTELTYYQDTYSIVQPKNQKRDSNNWTHAS